MKQRTFRLAVLVCGLAVLLPAQTEKKEFTVEPGKRLEMDLKMGGSIAISGWDQKKVQVAVDFHGTDAKDWEINYRQTDDGVVVEGHAVDHHSRNSPDFDINVPRSFDLKLRTAGGNVIVENISGEINGRTFGGDLKLRGLKGKIEFTTMGGEILLQDSDIDGQLKTMGGRVLFENIVGDVKGTSMGGNVVYRNVKPRSGKGNGQAVRITTMGGDINVEEAPEGADLHTMGGDIRIKSAARLVKAKTMGGDITIEKLDGSVNAVTMGGDIEVTETGGTGTEAKEIALTSMGGDVLLRIPEKWDAEITIEIGLPRHGGDHAKIVSDFPLEQTRGRKADGDHNDREYLFGKGKIGSGKSKIIIKTMNSEVRLKKG